MTTDQTILFVLTGTVLALFIWGRFRYDLVAFAALVVGVVIGVVPYKGAFSGFGHPAVVIIALVLIVSRGLSRSGAIELLARHVIDASRGLQSHIGIMAGVAAVLSTLMNNVAALVLLMPLDIQAARRAKRSPALTLMPISFASILGGMVTLIGTPPNIVIATFRADALGEPYRMFDFAPVGAVVAAVGVAYVALVGWRLIPRDRANLDTASELRELMPYVANPEVTEKSPLIGRRVRDLDALAEENEVSILGLIRRGERLPGRARYSEIRQGDLLVLEGGPEALDQFIGVAGLKFVGAEKYQGLADESLGFAEVVVPAGARIEGRSAMELRLLYRKGVSLIGISRNGKLTRERVRRSKIQGGDLLLLLGPEEQLPDVVGWLGCLTLEERGFEVTQRHKAALAVGAFAVAVALSSFGLIDLAVALGAVVALYVVFEIVPLSQLYESIEWPVIVLLGCMIPISAAVESSGGTALMAEVIVDSTRSLPTVAVLTILMVVTMTLSDVLNNVATALIAAPIAVDIADRLGANPDSFLMAVAVAASCAFLTPIGHKNNTIILGPGGYRFGDYWRMGLPLEILVIVLGVPMILLVWPL